MYLYIFNIYSYFFYFLKQALLLFIFMYYTLGYLFVLQILYIPKNKNYDTLNTVHLSVHLSMYISIIFCV